MKANTSLFSGVSVEGPFNNLTFFRNHYIFTSKRDVLQSSKYNYYDEKCLTAKYSAK